MGADTVPTRPVDMVLGHLHGMRAVGDCEWVARCPAHDDQRASLSVGVGRDGLALLNCHAGCRTEDVVAALGLTMGDLFPSGAVPAPSNGRAERHIVAAYQYTDGAGALLFEVVRFEPKGFAQRHPDSHGGSAWNMDGVRRVLYRLPEVVAAVREGRRVYVVEGEKDADNLSAVGLTATTNPGGAGKWREEYTEALRDAGVVILPDNDDPGREHAEHVAQDLTGVAAQVGIVALPDLPEKGDVSDWLAAGGTREALEALAAAENTSRVSGGRGESGTPPSSLVASGGWRVSEGQLTIEASGRQFDRGVVRAAVKVFRMDETGKSVVLHTDRLNLTSDTSRQRFIKRLKEKHPDADVPESALLTLAEMVERKPAKPRDPDEEPEDEEPFDGEPTITDIEDAVGGCYLLADPDLIRAPLAAKVAHELEGPPVWLLIVGPPSSTKTAALMLLARAERIYLLSQLTPRTFASGLVTAGDDPSLLEQLSHNEILIFKDFTTCLEMRSEDLHAILAQLREIFDGRFDQKWGSGKELHWRGKLGFLAGVTEAIDDPLHHHSMAIMGPRFLMLRPVQPGREDQAVRAMENAQGEAAKTRRLAAMVARFLSDLPRNAPAGTDEDRIALAKLADLVTRARSAVKRDGVKRELAYAPEPEMPARFAQQLYSLTRGFAMLERRGSLSDQDLTRTRRVAMDCIPTTRRAVLTVLSRTTQMKTSEVATAVKKPTTTVRRSLEDLQALGLVDCKKAEKQGSADLWSLPEPLRAHVATLARQIHDHLTRKVPETPSGGVTAGTDTTVPDFTPLPDTRDAYEADDRRVEGWDNTRVQQADPPAWATDGVAPAEVQAGGVDL